jgi:hypothetical protein
MEDMDVEDDNDANMELDEEEDEDVAQEQGNSLPLAGLRFAATGTFPKIADGDGTDPQLGPVCVYTMGKTPSSI